MNRQLKQPLSAAIIENEGWLPATQEELEAGNRLMAARLSSYVETSKRLRTKASAYEPHTPKQQ